MYFSSLVNSLCFTKHSWGHQGSAAPVDITLPDHYINCSADFFMFAPSVIAGPQCLQPRKAQSTYICAVMLLCPVPNSLWDRAP